MTILAVVFAMGSAGADGAGLLDGRLDEQIGRAVELAGAGAADEELYAAAAGVFHRARFYRMAYGEVRWAALAGRVFEALDAIAARLGAHPDAARVAEMMRSLGARGATI